MKRHDLLFCGTALAAGMALFGPSVLRAQDATSAAVGAPRSEDQRVVTEGVVPRTANSVARDAAEGRLAPAASAAIPGQVVGPAAAADPATRPNFPVVPNTRLQPAVISPDAAGVAATAPAGMDVAMLIEHAVGMAIEGSALLTVAQLSEPAADANNPSRQLLDQARGEIAASKALMTRAAADGSSIGAGSPARRFYTAANNYVATLGALGSQDAPPSPADRARISLLNHAVKSALDAGHIRQMGRVYAAGPAIQQLMGHATDMQTLGTQTILKIAGDNRPADNASPSVGLLASRARELLDAAEQLSAATPTAMAPPSRGGSVPLGNPGDPALPPGTTRPGANVGVLRDVRPEIIGGTQATGSPSVGTATGPEAATNVRGPGVQPNSNASRNGIGSGTNGGTGIDSDSRPTTNSTGNLPPR